MLSITCISLFLYLLYILLKETEALLVNQLENERDLLYRRAEIVVALLKNKAQTNRKFRPYSVQILFHRKLY